MSIESPEPLAPPSDPNPGAVRRMERAVFIAMIVAAATSVMLTLRTGQHNPSFLLKALFVFWVLSPFVCMAVAATKAPRWPKSPRIALTSLMLLLSIASVALYANVVFGPPRAQPAAMFLLVPFASWLCIAVFLALAALGARKRSISS